MRPNTRSLLALAPLSALLLAAAVPKSPTPKPQTDKQVSARPAAAASFQIASLGRLDALLTLCARADQKNRSTYERKRSELIVFGEGTKYEIRAPGSDTPEYKKAYDEVTTAAGKASKADLVAQCGRTLGEQAVGR